MAAAKRKKSSRAGELYQALQSFYWGGEFVQQLAQYDGSEPLVRANPLMFSPVSEGQPGIDRVTREFLEDVALAQTNRERMWYGEKPEPPPPPSRVVAVKAFVDRGHEVAVGSIWLANHQTVASSPDAFAPVKD